MPAFRVKEKLGGIFGGKTKEEKIAFCESKIIFGEAVKGIYHNDDFKLGIGQILNVIENEATRKMRFNNESVDRQSGILDCLDMIKTKIKLAISDGDKATLQIKKLKD